MCSKFDESRRVRACPEFIEGTLELVTHKLYNYFNMAESGSGETGFSTDESALAYLQSNIPPEAERQVVDLTPLKTKLFDTPNTPSPGRHEFKGENGLAVSFDLLDVSEDENYYHDYWQNLKPDSTIEGNWRPIYYMRDLYVKSSNFSYSLNHNGEIFWFPGLNSGDSELSHDYVNLGKKRIYLLDQDGFLARPIDLLGFFHEIGHIETYPTLPRSSDSLSHGYLGERLPYTAKRAAYQLQSEEAANTWMHKHVCKLFEDVGVPLQDVEDYSRHMQLKSYHDVFRRRFLTPPQAPITPAK